MLILVTPINQNNCFHRTPKAVRLKLDICNIIATVAIIIISTIYDSLLIRGERRDGLIADKDGWNYHIDVISKENFQFPEGATSTSTVKIVLLDAILKSVNIWAVITRTRFCCLVLKPMAKLFHIESW